MALARYALGQENVPVPIRLIQQAANAHGIPIPVTGIWDAATQRAWMLLIPVLGAPAAVVVGLTTEGPMALLPAPVDLALRAIADTPLAGTQIALKDVAQTIIDAVEIRRRYKAMRWGYRFRFRGLFEAWARSTEAVIKDLSAELEAHPTLLAAVATAVGKTSDEVLSIMRTPIVPKPGMGPAPAGPQTPLVGLGIVIADDVLIAIAAIAAALIVALAVVALLFAVRGTVRDLVTQVTQTICVKMVLDAAEHNEAARAVASRLPETCQIPDDSWLYWLVGGVTLAGAGYGYWRWRQHRRAA